MDKNLLISNGNYTVLNFNLLRSFPLRTALFIGYVYSLQKHYEASHQLTQIGDKSYIYCSKDYIATNLDIKRESLRLIVKSLVDANILSNAVRGNLQFYYINEKVLETYLDKHVNEQSCNKLLDAETVKKERVHTEMGSMFAKINVITNDPNIRQLLSTYLRIRKKRGLNALQWDAIIESLIKYIPQDMIQQRLERAIEGGWLTLVFDSDIKKASNIKANVVYNDSTDELRQKQIDDYLNSTKGVEAKTKDDDGKYY